MLDALIDQIESAAPAYLGMMIQINGGSVWFFECELQHAEAIALIDRFRIGLRCDVSVASTTCRHLADKWRKASEGTNDAWEFENYLRNLRLI